MSRPIGLHEVEKRRLLAQLRALKAQGNTILLVEHDPHLIAAADRIIDIGPLAGSAGGEVVYQGDYAGLLAAQGSVTGSYLSGRARLPEREKVLVSTGSPRLSLAEVCTNNLQNVAVEIPLGALVGVAGVSGSGKSSLVMKTLVPLLERSFNRGGAPAEENDAEGAADGEGIVFFAGPPGGSGRASAIFAPCRSSPSAATTIPTRPPISSCGIRSASCSPALPRPRRAAMAPGQFFFNAGGACPACSGSGKRRIWLGGPFFATQLCPTCHGRRFQAEVLTVHYRGKSILDVLEMTVDEACIFFADTAGIRRVLEVLARSGMGYLTLGQPAPSLSGGEAQRIKLAHEISRNRSGQTLYILDEPDHRPEPVRHRAPAAAPGRTGAQRQHRAGGRTRPVRAFELRLDHRAWPGRRERGRADHRRRDARPNCTAIPIPSPDPTCMREAPFTFPGADWETADPPPWG